MALCNKRPLNSGRFIIMKQTTLLKLALISSILGTCLLYILSETIPIPEKTISEIKEIVDGKIRLNGVIKEIKQTEKSIVYAIEKPEQISAISFGNIEKVLKIGDKVEIVGEISEFKGKKQIIIEKIN